MERRQFRRKQLAGSGRLTGLNLRAWLTGTLVAWSVFLTNAPAELRDGGINPANLGKGDWIYALTDATNQLGGHIGSVTNETSLMQFYRSQGLRFVVVKAATSDQLFKGCYNSPQFTRALVEVAHANGLAIFGYNRSYGSNVLGEIAVANYVFSQGADGFVWDAEAEWEANNRWIGSTGPAKAWRLCSTVRSNWPSKFLAHAPFPIISYHPTFPYKEFGYWCDAVMPQIYHSGWTSVLASASGGINWSDCNWSNWHRSLANSNSVINGVDIAWTNAIKPLAPVVEVYGPPGSSRCAAGAPPIKDRDLEEFLDYLSVDPGCPNELGYKGVSFWRADLHGVAQWEHIREHSLGGPEETERVLLDDSAGLAVGAWTSICTYSNGTFLGSGRGSDTNSFGTNYLICPGGSGGEFVEFKPSLLTAGNYQVYEWHPFRSDASARVPFLILGAGETNRVYVNQQTNAGGWNWIGRFNFSSGHDCVIRIGVAIPETNAVVMVDALKLVLPPN